MFLNQQIKAYVVIMKADTVQQEEEFTQMCKKYFVVPIEAKHTLQKVIGLENAISYFVRFRP